MHQRTKQAPTPLIDVVRYCINFCSSKWSGRAAVAVGFLVFVKVKGRGMGHGTPTIGQFGQIGDSGWSRLKFLSFKRSIVIAQYQCIANYVHANACIYLLSEQFSSATVRLLNFIITNHDATTLAKLSSPITLTLGSLLASCSSFSVTYPQEQR